jgi:nitroreductase
VTATDRERIQGLLAEGWRLLEAGDAREAALVFGRVAMVEPARAEAIRGLASARGAITESERRTDERLDEARRALATGQLAAARAGLEAVIADGGDRDHAAALLDRLDERGGRLERAQLPAAEPVAGPVRRPSPVSWSRRAFAAASTIVLVVLGAGVFSSWDRLLFGLTRPPAPRPSGVAALPPPARGGDRALAEARRLLDAGESAAALAALDRVGPEEPAYPFARQLRQQAELALREGPPRVSRTGLRP